MLKIEMHEPHRPSPAERFSDAPQRLRELTDVAKGMAIAEALTKVAGTAFEADLQSVCYDSFHRSLDFQKPAELCVRVRLQEGKNCDCLKALSDTHIEAGGAMNVPATGRWGLVSIEVRGRRQS